MIRPYITLTTDFGLQDGYVGVMKGVIANIMPDVRFIDIAHTLPAQDVRSTAFLLWSVLPYFSSDCIHLVVVDPGVGTKRRALAAWTPWGTLVGPDNGVFSYVWTAAPPTFMVSLEDPAAHLPNVSATFHGRDIFAPVTGHIARGVPLRDLGPVIHDPVRLPLPTLEITTTHLRGEVIYIDHFGNAVTSIGRWAWRDTQLHLSPAFGQGETHIFDPASLTLQLPGHTLGPVRHAYGEALSGDPLLLVGSSGMLEIAINQGNAAQHLGLHIGTPVELHVSLERSLV